MSAKLKRVVQTQASVKIPVLLMGYNESLNQKPEECHSKIENKNRICWNFILPNGDSRFLRFTYDYA